MSVYPRGRKWCAVAYEPGTGKRIWLGTFDRKKGPGGADEAFQQAKTRLHRGRGSVTIAEFAARWMDDYPRRKESTTQHYRQQIKALVATHGHLRLDQLDRPTAREFAQGSSTWPAARAMFSDAVRDELCDRNPFLNMRLQQSKGRRGLIVPTETEVRELAAAAKEIHGAWGERVYANLILFAAWSGLRPGELHGLDWRHVDLHGSTVTVERQWTPKLRKMTPPKNGQARSVYLTPPAADALGRLPDTGDAVFTSPRGGRLGGSTSFYYWSPVRAAVGHPDWPIYVLRHFFGTELALRGLGAPAIAQAMGHTDGGKLALSTYIHMTAQDSRARIAAAFGERPRLAAVDADSISAAEGSR